MKKTRIIAFVAIVAVVLCSVLLLAGCHEHATSEWEFDEEYHWKECKDCDEILEKVAHTFDNKGNCTVCGYHKHITTDEWKSDAENHWKVCAGCGKVLDKVAHTFNDNGNCTVCGSHKHITTDEWKNDAENHWKVCVGCGEVLDKIAHSYDEKGNCTVCAYHKHITTDEWKNDAENHWKECVGCGEVLDKATHSYDEKGNCTVCAYHKHITTDEWKNDAENHWKECVGCGEVLDKVAHSYDEKGNCIVCGYHKHITTDEWKNDAENHWKVCVGCGEVVEQAAHSYDAKGNCTVCGYHKHITTEEWKSDVYNHWKECVGCGEILEKGKHTVQASGECSVCGKTNLPIPWDGTFEEIKPDSDGNYSVSKGTQLAWIAKEINAGTTDFSGKTIRLTQDINLGERSWPSINDQYGKLSNATIDGNGFAIRNLFSSKVTVTSGSGYGVGFIGNLKTPITIKNITFDKAIIKSRNANVLGVVLGYTYSTTVMENVKVTNSEVTGYGKVGVIVGFGADPGVKITMTNCESTGNKINACYNGGGLIGLVLRSVGVDNTVINNCIVENNTFIGKTNKQYLELNGETAQFTQDDLPSGESVPRQMYGKYWIDGSLLWSAYSEYYCSYGSSEYDPTIEVNGKQYMIANSEICVNVAK